MRINNVYVGLGLGDSSTEIQKIKAFMRTKFASYAGDLADTPDYDQQMATAVAEMQNRYNAAGKLAADKYMAGVINLETKYVMGYLKRPEKNEPLFVTVEGHLSNMFAGPVADTATQLEAEGLCHHQPVGYSNGSIPFDNASGVKELARIFGSTVMDNGVPFPAGTPWISGAFSQGGIVWFDFVDQYLAPGKPLEWREQDRLGTLAYGNPCRGVDSIAPWAQSWIKTAGTHGLDPYKRYGLPGCPDLPRDFMDVYREGDIFAQNGDDAMSAVCAAVYQAVARGDFASNPYSIAAQIANFFQHPFDEVFAIVMAMIHGVLFLADNPNPHYSPYDITGGVDWARQRLLTVTAAAA